MDNLVFTASRHCNDTPYTNPATIAEKAQVSVSTLESLYKSHYVDFCKHIPNLKRKHYRFYEPVMPERFNEAQAFLMLSLLKNTELVQGLKFEFIQQFNGVNKELAVRREQKGFLSFKGGVDNPYVRKRYTHFCSSEVYRPYLCDCI